MEIKESGDSRVHMTDYGIPTIQLGSGGVIISDLIFEGQNVSGVGFSLGAGEIAEYHEVEIEKVFFQIISTSPESLQVLINRLESAKSDLESKDGRCISG